MTSKLKNEFLTQNPALGQLFFDLYLDITIYRRRIAENKSKSEFRMLNVIFMQEPCSLKKICNILGVTTPSGSVMVDKLVKRGIVQRVQDPDDRRKVLITLTDCGRELAEKDYHEQCDKLDKAFDNLSSQDKEKFRICIQELTTILEGIPLDPEEETN